MSRRADYSERSEAMERLIQNDRIIQEARMLPTGRPLTKDEHSTVRAALQRYIADRTAAGDRITLASVAKAVGYSPSVLTQWVKDHYRGDSERVARAINTWIERQVGRDEAIGDRSYVETWVCEEMMAFVRMADRHRKMAAITAPPGSGKDMAISVIAEELNAFLIECNKQMTPKQLLLALADAVGGKVTRGANLQIMRSIVDRLKDRSCLIFLNEAQQLSKECAPVIRYLYDNSGVPIIMFGSAEVFGFIDDRASGGGQFWRRCIRLNISRRKELVANPDDPNRSGRPLFTRDEIKAMLRMRQVKLHRDAVDLVYQIAQLEEHGTLGLAMDVVSFAVDLYPAEEITRDMLIEALELVQDVEFDSIFAKIARAEQHMAPEPVAKVG